MKLKFIFLLPVMLCAIFSTQVYAQFLKTKGYAQISGGPLFNKPDLGPNLNLADQWKGYTFRIRQFEFTYTTGLVNKTSNADSLFRGEDMNVNFHFPLLSSVSVGRRIFGIKGFLIQPAITLGYGLTDMDRNREQNEALHLHAEPGISLQLPYIILDARYVGGLYISKDPAIKSGPFGYPEISIQIDGLYDLFNPQTVAGGIQSVPTYSITGSSTDYYNGTTTTYYEQDGWAQIQGYGTIIKPFIGLTPKLSFSPRRTYRDETALTGLGASFRWSYFSFDLIHQSGHIGFCTDVNEDGTDPNHHAHWYKEKHFDQSSGFLSGKSYASQNEFRVGFDVARIVWMLMYPGAYGTSNLMKNPRFFRFYVGMGWGQLNVHDSSPQYLHEDSALAYLNTNLSNPNFINNSFTNPLQFADGFEKTSFGAFELGSLGLSWEKHYYKTAGLMSGQTVSIYWTLPLGRIIKAYGGRSPEDY